MNSTNPAGTQTIGGDTRSRLSAAGAWRWSGVLLMVGAGLGMIAENAEPIPFYTETSARVDADANPSQPRAWSSPSTPTGVAVVRATRASLASGTLRLAQGPSGSSLTVQVEGLVPGTHEIRVHSSGDCSDDEGYSAGDAYAYDSGSEQGLAGLVATFHVGSDWTGRARVEVPGLQLAGETSVIGRSLVIHLVKPAPESGADAPAGTVMACATVGVA